MQNDRKLRVFDPNNRAQTEGSPRIRRGCFARNVAFILRTFRFEDVGLLLQYLARPQLLARRRGRDCGCW